MSIEFFVILALAAVAFGIGLMRAYQAVGDTRRKVAKVVKAKAGQVERLRRAGRNSLNLKRAARDAVRRKEMAGIDLEEAQSQFREAQTIDHRVFVLDDRRTKADQSWVATLRHDNMLEVQHAAQPEAVQSWVRGRRFLVFALDSQKARDKVQARYPERLGYRLISIAPPVVPTSAKPKL